MENTRLILVEPHMQPVPTSLQIEAIMGHVVVTLHFGPHPKSVSGCAMLLKGTADVFDQWLKSFSHHYEMQPFFSGDWTRIGAG